MTIDATRADFDRLARLDSGGWNHSSYYHPFLLEQLPPACEDSLEIGCGTGSFTRLLAQRSRHVTALDLSPQMIKIAQERSRQYSNIDYLVADALEWTFPVEHFDCIVSITTLHHLPLEIILPKITNSLKPEGVLLAIDLWKTDTIAGLLISMIAIPVQIILSLIHTGRLRQSRDVRQAWAAHGRNDKFLPISSIRRLCNNLLPHATIKRQLLWRYSFVWKKPIAS
jgi:2-polyprenyl-3-methyl-5-hydroxy-6-metoxy-1,4-benzoquinol methylase